MPALKFRLFSPQTFYKETQAGGEFKVNKNGIYFAVRNKSVKLTLNAANLPVASLIIDNGCDDWRSDNLASLVCGSDENINLTRKQRHLLLWHHRLGHASFRLIRWLGRNNFLYGGEVDQDATILCDSCRLA